MKQAIIYKVISEWKKLCTVIVFKETVVWFYFQIGGNRRSLFKLAFLCGFRNEDGDGVMDILFTWKFPMRSIRCIWLISGNNETLIDAELFTADKEVEITFTWGLPEFVARGSSWEWIFLTTSQGSTVNSLCKLMTDRRGTWSLSGWAACIWRGSIFCLEKMRSCFMQPLQFSI